MEKPSRLRNNEEERTQQRAAGKQSTPRSGIPGWVTYAVFLSNILMSVGRDFAYDFPQSLSPQLIQLMQIDTVKVGMLFSAYSLPNILLAPCFGQLIAQAGCGKVALLCVGLMMVGHLLVNLAIEANSYWTLFTGRCIFGIGAECCTILQFVINENWFFGKFLTVGSSSIDMSCVIAKILGNYWMCEMVVRTGGVKASFRLQIICGCVTMVAGFIYFALHNRYFHKLVCPIEDDTEAQRLLEEMDEIYPAEESHHRSDSQSIVIEEGSMSVRRAIMTWASHFREMNQGFWLVCAILVVQNGYYYQFSNIETEILQKKFNIEYEQTNTFTIIPEMAMLVASLPLSKLVQHFGYKPQALMLLALIALANFLWMKCTSNPSTLELKIIFIFIGLGGCGSGIIYSCLGLMVARSKVSFAYALCNCIENISLTILPAIFGFVSENQSVDSYERCIVLLAFLAAMAIFTSILLIRNDRRMNWILTNSENSRSVLHARGALENELIL